MITNKYRRRRLFQIKFLSFNPYTHPNFFEKVEKIVQVTPSAGEEKKKKKGFRFVFRPAVLREICWLSGVFHIRALLLFFFFLYFVSLFLFTSQLFSLYRLFLFLHSIKIYARELTFGPRPEL